MPQTSATALADPEGRESWSRADETSVALIESVRVLSALTSVQCLAAGVPHRELVRFLNDTTTHVERPWERIAAENAAPKVTTLEDVRRMMLGGGP